MEFTGERFEPDFLDRRMSQDHESRYKFASRFVPGKIVLDIACGAGYGSYQLAVEGAISVVGADISPESIEFAREKYKAENLTYRVQSMLDIEDVGSVDIITSFESIEHVQDYMKVLRSFYVALKPGGLLILSTPNRLITSPQLRSMSEKPKNPYHVREFSVEEIVSSVRNAGFRVTKEDIYGQRQRRYYASRILRKIQKILISPDTHSSSEVLPLKRAPRYTVIVARRLE